MNFLQVPDQSMLRRVAVLAVVALELPFVFQTGRWVVARVVVVQRFNVDEEAVAQLAHDASDRRLKKRKKKNASGCLENISSIFVKSKLQTAISYCNFINNWVN